MFVHCIHTALSFAVLFPFCFCNTVPFVFHCVTLLFRFVVWAIYFCNVTLFVLALHDTALSLCSTNLCVFALCLCRSFFLQHGTLFVFVMQHFLHYTTLSFCSTEHLLFFALCHGALTFKTWHFMCRPKFLYVIIAIILFLYSLKLCIGDGYEMVNSPILCISDQYSVSMTNTMYL